MEQLAAVLPNWSVESVGHVGTTLREEWGRVRVWRGDATMTLSPRVYAIASPGHTSLSRALPCETVTRRDARKATNDRLVAAMFCFPDFRQPHEWESYITTDYWPEKECIDNFPICWVTMRKS